MEETDAEAVDVLTRLVDEAAGRALAALRAEAQVAADPLPLGRTIAWLNLRIMELREPDTAGEAIEQLLGWLTGPEEDR